MRRFVVLVLLVVGIAVPCRVRARQADDTPAGQADTAIGGSQTDFREAQRRAVDERQAGILSAIEEGERTAAEQLLEECLRDGSPLQDAIDRRLVARLLDIVRVTEGQEAPRHQIALGSLRVILDRRPEAFHDRGPRVGRSRSIFDMFGGAGLPRFVAAVTSWPFASEARLVAEGVAGEAPACRLFRVVRAAAVPRRDRGDDGPELAPHLLPEADLEAVGGGIEWEVMPADDMRGALLAATVRLPGPGMYALVQEEDGFRYCQPIEFATFRLVAREVDAEGWPCVVMAIDTRTGRGVPDVDVTYLDEGERDWNGAAKGEGIAVPLGRTDRDGVAVCDLPRRKRALLPALECRRDGETRHCGLARSPNEDRFAPLRRAGPGGAPAAGVMEADPFDLVPHLLVTTDAPLVRPGGTIRYRAVVRDAAGGMVAPSGEPVRVEIRDGSGRLHHAAEHRWGGFGSLSGAWTVPVDAPPGPYDVEVVGPPLPWGVAGSRWSSRARFAVSVVPPPDIGMRAEGNAEPGTARLTAEYIVGGPVADADVEWRVVSVGPLFSGAFRPRLFPTELSGLPWWLSATTFEPLVPLDDPRAWLCHDRIADAERQRATQPEPEFLPFCVGPRVNHQPERVWPLGMGRGRTGADGTLSIAWQATEAEGETAAAREAPPAVWVEATIRDVSGVPAEVRARLAPHRGRLALEIGTDRLFAMPEDPIEVRVRAAAAGDGLPAAGVPVVVRGVIAGPRPDADSEDEREFFRALVTTDERGRAHVSTRVGESGRVRWQAEVAADAGTDGTPVVATADQWCAGEEAVDSGVVLSGGHWRRGGMATFLAITPDRLAYAPGESIRLLVRGNPAPQHLFVGIETRTSRRVEPFAFQGRVGVIEIPVAPDDRGLGKVWVAAWNGAEIVTAERALFIHPAGQTLDVAVRTDGGGHEPGHRATVDVEVRGHDGAGRRAEVEIGLVDTAFDAIVDSPRLHPLVALDPIQSWRGRMTAADDVARLWLSLGGEERPWTTFPPEPGGIDRLARRAFAEEGASGLGDRESWEQTNRGRLGWDGAAVFASSAPGVRRPPPGASDVAPEVPQAWGIVTGDDGRVRVEIDLPERSSRYRVVARAVTSEGEAGLGETTIVARRPVGLRILAPRSVHEGDATTVSLMVASHLDAPAGVALRLRADGASLGERTIELRPGERRRVDWPLEAGNAGTRHLEAEADWAGGNERAALEIPVLPIAREYRARLVASVGPRAREDDSSVVLPEGIETADVELTIDVESFADEAELARNIENALGAVIVDMEPCDGLIAAVTILEAVRAGGFRGRPLEGVAGEVVDQLIRRVSQVHDIGLGWHTDDSDPDEVDPTSVSLVLERLLAAREAGCFVDPRVIESAAACLAVHGTDLHALAVRALAGDTDARREIAAKRLEAILAPFDDTDGAEERSPSPAETMALLVLAGREDLLPWLPVAPPGEGAARSVRTLREAASIVRVLGRLAPDDDRVAALVEWACDGAPGNADGGPHGSRRRQFSLDEAWIMILEAHRPRDDRPARWSLRINGEDVAAGGAGRTTVTTSLLRPGENTFRLESDGSAPFDMTIGFRCRLEGPGHDRVEGTAADSSIGRRLVSAAPGEEEFFTPLRSGATVSTRDVLRLTWFHEARSERLPEIVGTAGLEPWSRPEWAWDLRDVDDPLYGKWQKRDVSSRHVEEVSFGEIDVRPTCPGHYRLPVTRIDRGSPGGIGEGFHHVFEEFIEPFELFVEE